MGLAQVVFRRLQAGGMFCVRSLRASPSLRLTITKGWKFSVSPLSNL
jgi:hypothetical protein